MHYNRTRWMLGLALGLASLSAGAEPVRIVASFYPVYIATLNVVQGAPGVALANLTPPLAGCLHEYQLTPGDMAKLVKADILIVNGAGMEAFLAKAQQQAPRLKVIDASAGLELLPGAEGANPHVWLSVTLAIRQVENIAAGLARCDPERAEHYRRNAAAYGARLTALRERLRTELQTLSARDIVTFHEAFAYFAREFGLNVAAVIEREPGSEPSARELADIVKTIRRLKIKAVFVEPQYPAQSAAAIARETGTGIYTLDPAVTGPLTADAYLRIMATNACVLRQALR